jgi:hypothetical protein
MLPNFIKKFEIHKKEDFCKYRSCISRNIRMIQQGLAHLIFLMSVVSLLAFTQSINNQPSSPRISLLGES